MVGQVTQQVTVRHHFQALFTFLRPLLKVKFPATFECENISMLGKKTMIAFFALTERIHSTNSNGRIGQGSIGLK